MLRKGDFLPGDALREATLANQLGVSRGPIREAFRSLEEKGLSQHRILLIQPLLLLFQRLNWLPLRRSKKFEMSCTILQIILVMRLETKLKPKSVNLLEALQTP